VKDNDLKDPSTVTGVMIRDALGKLNDTSSPDNIVRVGADQMEIAIKRILAGQPINYEGASGPVDFNAEGDVVTNIVHWVVKNRQFQEVEVFDCVSDPATCPLRPIQ